MKAQEIGALREQTLADNGEQLFAAAAALGGVFDAGARLLALGNGGSATDAMDLVADLLAAGRAGDRPDRGRRDPDRDRERHRRRGDLLAAGDRVRPRRRRAGRAVDVGQLGQRDRRARRGAPPGLVTVALVGYDGGRIGAEGLADHVIVTPFRAHSAHPGGAGERLPRAVRADRDQRAGSTGVSASRRRVRARVVGTVQGVGFRPYVYRLAGELELDGWVLNDARGVLLEVEGAPDRVSAVPDPADPRRAAARGDRACRVGGGGARRRDRVLDPREPARGGGRRPGHARQRDVRGLPARAVRPGDRRHRYPFINCTNCGPRFTIVRGVPYDRPHTTMAAFPMCAACQAEYDDPGDRRFHAQPNACPGCGPRRRCWTPPVSVWRPGTRRVRRRRRRCGTADRGGQGHRRLPPRLPRR